MLQIPQSQSTPLLRDRHAQQPHLAKLREHILPNPVSQLTYKGEGTNGWHGIRLVDLSSSRGDLLLREARHYLSKLFPISSILGHPQGKAKANHLILFRSEAGDSGVVGGVSSTSSYLSRWSERLAKHAGAASTLEGYHADCGGNPLMKTRHKVLLEESTRSG